MNDENLKLRGGNDLQKGGDIKLYGSSRKDEPFRISEPVKDAGYYRINGHLNWHFPKKPSWWHRFWSRITLGWIWID